MKRFVVAVMLALVLAFGMATSAYAFYMECGLWSWPFCY